MTPPNDGFSDKIQKSFDFASDLVKQEITISDVRKVEIAKNT